MTQNESQMFQMTYEHDTSKMFQMTHNSSQNVLKRYPNKLLMQNIMHDQQDPVFEVQWDGSDKLSGDRNVAFRYSSRNGKLRLLPISKNR